MNRWKYASPVLLDGEITYANEYNVKLYDGDLKTEFEGGELFVTSIRLLWGRSGAMAMGQTCLALSLSHIAFFEEEPQHAFSFSKAKKLIVHIVGDPTGDDGPRHSTNYTYIKIGFKDGYTNNILGILSDLLQRRMWVTSSPATLPESTRAGTSTTIKLRSGIVGIERSLEAKQKATNESINTAFQDLDKLMTMAKDMVRLSKVIATKIKEKQGGITDDETVEFRSYLLSLGIDDPVTRDGYKTTNSYHQSLATQLSEYLSPLIEEMGGIMALTDVYCRVNRARGMEMISPEDLLQACKAMNSLNVPLGLHRFSSGVSVLQFKSLNNDSIAEATSSLLEDKGSMTPHELAASLGISLTLAKERLLLSESLGKCCRDDNIAGVRFYPNLFLTKDIEEQEGTAN